MDTWTFTATLWRHPGTGGWHFVTLPTEVTDEILDRADRGGPGFGAVAVTVSLATSTWRTSVFPDRKSQSLVLPVKKAVRDAQRLAEGDDVTVDLRLRDHP